MKRIALLAGVLPAVLLVLALRVLFGGTTAYENVIFAELYVWLVGIVLAIWLFLRVPVAWLLGAGFAGAVVAHVLFARGESVYCNADLRNHTRGFPLPPDVFHCRQVPIELAGYFVAWGIGSAVVLSRRRAIRG